VHVIQLKENKPLFMKKETIDQVSQIIKEKEDTANQPSSTLDQVTVSKSRPFDSVQVNINHSSNQGKQQGHAVKRLRVDPGTVANMMLKNSNGSSDLNKTLSNESPSKEKGQKSIGLKFVAHSNFMTEPTAATATPTLGYKRFSKKLVIHDLKSTNATFNVALYISLYISRFFLSEFILLILNYSNGFKSNPFYLKISKRKIGPNYNPQSNVFFKGKQLIVVWKNCIKHVNLCVSTSLPIPLMLMLAKS
jgi:hypothetical protein